MIHALLLQAATLLTVMAALWTIAVRIRDVSFIDSMWGLGMAALAMLSWIHAAQPGARATMIATMAVLWGIRLGVHLFVRWRREGEDKRYAKMLGKAKEQRRFARASLTRVFLPQAVLLFLTCLPAQLGTLASANAAIGPLALAGAGLWLVGMIFETVGDWQLARFRADPASKGKVLDTGLWRYTRHPNYFGDTCVWWGIWLAAAEAGLWVALASLIGPVFLTFTLTRWSGKPMLEKGLAKSRPGYAEYVARTSGFVPLPPRARTP